MDNTKRAEILGLLGVALCGLCCAFPVIGAAIGFASLTAIAFYLEKIGFVMIGLAAFFVWYASYPKRKAEKALKPCSCSTTCGCKQERIASN